MNNTLVSPATDAQMAKYSSSLAHSHAAGALVAGTGGYEYTGEAYDAGHTFPHTKIASVRGEDGLHSEMGPPHGIELAQNRIPRRF